MNFEEALRKRVAMQHREAILEELLDYLNQFLPTDLGASEALLEVSECMIPIVGQEALENVVSTLSAELQKTVKELNTLSKMRMSDGKKKR
jgi:hypothetical protein